MTRNKQLPGAVDAEIVRDERNSKRCERDESGCIASSINVIDPHRACRSARHCQSGSVE